jgi:hypothetical protein
MKPFLNSEQWTSLVRGALQVALAPGSYLVLKGGLPADVAQQLIVPLTGAITFGGGILLTRWGVMAHSPAAVAAAVVSNTPVASAVVNALNSDSMPNVKVVRSTSASPAVSITQSGAIMSVPSAS